MQKQKLDVLPAREVLKSLEDAFRVMPIVPRDCVKSLNRLVYNLCRQKFTPDVYKNILFQILRAYTSKDTYLKSLIYAILEILSEKTEDGILGLNSILKDIDDRSISVHMRNSAFRALFTNLPQSMRFDFEKFIKTALLERKSRDNAVCIASEYFKDMKIDTKTFDTIEDYHLSFFNKLPINKYTGMIQIKRMAKSPDEFHKIGTFLAPSIDSVTFFEAAKALSSARQEIAAPFVDKAVSTLRIYLKKSPVEQFSAMKILSKLSVNFPSKVAKANGEIEDLVQDQSKTVSMLSILTLLKTGTDETAKQLSSKLEPLMVTMSESYKMIAIDTIEKLTKTSRLEYVSFLKSSLFNRGSSVSFKRFILKKFESLLGYKECRSEITKLLCKYVEDPEYYQLSMDILGILSECIEESRDLVHIYNRVILDNYHVRNCAYQALFDLDRKFQTIKSLGKVNDPETDRIRHFLSANTHLKKGPFDLEELGDLKGEVLKYLKPLEASVPVEELPEGLVKECRSIALTSDGNDIAITVIKKIFTDKIILAFNFENRMSKVTIDHGILALDLNSKEFSLKLSEEDFRDNKSVLKEIEIPREGCLDVINGVFEYQISLEDDPNETEKETLSLTPFDINVLDFIKPISVPEVPSNKRQLELKFRSKPIDAVSKIVSRCNMFLIADKDSFELQGYLEKHAIVIKGVAAYSKHTSVSIEISCDDDSVLEQVVSAFE